MKYTYRPEIMPYCSGGLAPRNYLTKKQWTNIKQQRVSEIGECKCEICDAGSQETKIELHESFVIEKETYRLTGVHLLCYKCHLKVHPIGSGHDMVRYMNQLMVPPQKYFAIAHGILNKLVEWSRLPEDDIKSKLVLGIVAAVKFSLSTEVKVDYSFLSAFKIDYLECEKQWANKYNHSYASIKFVFDFLSHPTEYCQDLVRHYALNRNKKRKHDYLTPYRLVDKIYDFIVCGPHSELFSIHFDTAVEGYRYKKAIAIFDYLGIKSLMDLPFLSKDMDNFLRYYLDGKTYEDICKMDDEDMAAIS